MSSLMRKSATSGRQSSGTLLFSTSMFSRRIWLREYFCSISLSWGIARYILIKVPSASWFRMRLIRDCKNRIRHAHDLYIVFQVRSMGKLPRLYWRSGRNQCGLDWVCVSTRSESSYLQSSSFFVDVYLSRREFSDGETFVMHIFDDGYQC